MSDQTPTAALNGATGATPPAPDPFTAVAGLAEERPEMLVGAAFIGGLLLAKLLGRLAR